MKKEWTSLRITVLLYLVIAVVPIGAFFGYKSYRDVNETAYMVNKMMKVPEGLLILSAGEKLQSQRSELQKIDSAVEALREWVEVHKNDKDYVGGGSLPERYDLFYRCWKDVRLSEIPAASQLRQCVEQVHSLIFALERMYILKEQRFENIMFVTVASVVLLLLLSVYFVRLYIAAQIRRKAIHDFETTLYNRKFVEESFKKMCAESVRYGKKLTVLRIRIPEFAADNTTLDAGQREKLMHRFGTAIWDLVRESDVAAHTEEDDFILLLPQTSAEQAAVVERRIREKAGKGLTLIFSTGEAGAEGSCEAVYKKCFSKAS